MQAFTREGMIFVGEMEYLGEREHRPEGLDTEEIISTRESRGIDRFCDYSCVYCVILPCARRAQSNGKHKIHQACQCDAYV